MFPTYPKSILFILFTLLSFGAKGLTASFTANIISGCAPLTVNFTNTSTGATSYQWTLGNGNTSFQTNASGTYPTAGTYTVILTAYNGTASSTYSLNITAYAPPVVGFSASPTTICQNTPITFTDQSTLNSPGTGSYSWNFGNGASGSGSTTTYTYTTPGTYNVNLFVTSSAGCRSSLTRTGLITVLASPIGSFSASPATLCSNSPTTTFTNSTSGSGTLSYTWDFGDGTTSTQTSPTHTYNGTGPYTVKLYVMNSAGCTDTVIQSNYITIVPGTIASFTGPAGVCIGAPATFTNTSTPGSTNSDWLYGDGSGGNGSVATHTYTAAGTYHVSLTNNNNTCTDTTGHNIIIYPSPSVAFTASPTQPCPAPVSIQFSASIGSSGYSWQFGDGGTSGQQSPTHTYNSNGFYNVKLFATSVNGCVDSGFFTEKIYPLNMDIHQDIVSGCVPFPVHFSEFVYYNDPVTGLQVPYPYPVSAYSWSFGDGGTAYRDTITHTFQTFGTYTVTLTATTSNGCSITKTVTINAGTPVPPSFTASPLNACVKVPVSFSNTTPINATTTFKWYFGDGNSSTAYSTTHPYGVPGTFNITLISTNNGCTDTATRAAYVTINPPNAKFQFTYSCNARNIAFSNISMGATSFLWSFGDGMTDAVNVSPSHLYAANGTYTVTLSTHNSTSGCSDTAIGPITLSSPIANISVPDTALCRGDTVTMVGSLSAAPAGAARSFSWYLDNFSFIDTTSSFSYAYHSIGQKQVILVIGDYRGCNDTAYRTLLIAHPTVQFTGSPTPVCSPMPVLFTDQTTDAPTTYYTSHKWDLGDGAVLTGNASTVSHGYSSAGSFTIKLFVTDNIGCSDSLVKPAYIVVHKPKAIFSVAATACQNRAVTFNNTSTGSNLTYAWSFGDGATSTLQTPVHFYMRTGTYTVSLVVTDDLGCKDTLTRPNYVTVVADPVAAFHASDTFSICSPLIDTFTNLSAGGTSYTWSFGDGNTSSFFNTTNPYTTPGQYNVRLVVTNTYGCTDTATVLVNLLGYAGLLTYSPIAGCVPLTVSFTANVTGVPSFTYDFSDGNTFTTSSTSTTHTYTIPGPHVPRLILSNNHCQAYSAGIDTIKVDGITPGFKTIPAPICGADSVQFIDTSKAYFTPIISEKWIFNNGVTSILSSPLHYYYTPGTYNVSLIATSASGCVDTFISKVVVHPIPVISAGSDTTVCKTDSAQLQPSGGVSYVWSPSALLSCSACTAPHTAPSVATTYYVVGTDVYGCTNTDSVMVRLKLKATGTADTSGDLCITGSLQLFAHDSFVNAQYLWLPANSLSNNLIADPFAKPDTSTRYMVIIKEGRCIPDTAYVQVNVHPLPVISAAPGQTILAGSSVELQTTETNVTRYQWQPPDGLDCDTCANPVATPKKTTLYQVFGYTDYGCVDSARVKIDVICDHSQVFLPNTFTPNNDGSNDRFYPRGKGLQIIRSFRIYDRWGQKIFEKDNMQLNDMSNGWDGTFKGAKLTPDVFVYVVDAICDTGSPITWTGDITLLR